jgi:hypothetical protein
VLLIAVIFSFRFSLSIKRALPQTKAWLNENLEKIASEIPEVEIKDGTLVLPKLEFIKEWKKEKFALIIEPNQENAYAILEQYDNVLLLTQTKFITKTLKSDSSQEIKTYNLDKVKIFKIFPIQSGMRVVLENKEFQINNSTVNRWLKIVSLLVFPITLCFVFLWYSFTKLLQLLFFSLASLIFNAQSKANLSYKELLNIGIYVLVPPTTLAVIKNVFNIPIPVFGLLYLLIYLFYLALGIRASAAKEEQTESPDINT